MTTAGDRLGTRLPDFDFTDPAVLEALYGNFGWADHWRKAVLANCEEMVRAEYTAKEEKITETRITTLARLHPSYVDFLCEHLEGRRLREKNVLESNSVYTSTR